MQLINAPGKLVLPFANAGAKNAIPVASQIGIVAGAASLTDGFPPLTRTPLAAGGVPPSGLDMNGIIYELSAILRWANAGAGYVYDGTFAANSNVGGYPKGARVLRSDGMGYWLNTADNNTTDPEGAGAVAAGWVPDFTNGAASVTMSGSNATLAASQYGKPILVITGTLTANLNLIFPSIAGQWTVVNATTGAYSITCKTAAGSGVPVTQNAATIIYCDTINVNALVYLTQGAADLRYAALAGLATQAFSMSTAAQFDNTTLGATAAFVQRALGNLSGYRLLSGNATLTAADAGKGVIAQGAGAITVTLPLLSTFVDGAVIGPIQSQSANAVAVVPQGSDVITASNLNNALTSISIPDGDYLFLIRISATKWGAVAGSALLKYAASFAGVTSAAGYQKLPNGNFECRGTFVASGTPGAAVAVTFPLAFTAIHEIVITAQNASTTTTSAWYDTPTTAGFNGRCNIAGLTCSYIAKGAL